MTKKQFGVWIEEHYRELYAIAVDLGSNYEPEDIVQSAVVAMLSRSELKCRTPETMWPWAVAVVRETRAHAARSDERRAALRTEVKKFARAGLLIGRTGGGRQTAPKPGSDSPRGGAA